MFATTLLWLLALLLLTLRPKLLEEGASLVRCHLVNLGSCLGAKPLQRAAHALLRFGWKLVDPRG